MANKFLHELVELADTMPDDLVLVSRNEVEFKQKRSVLFGGQGLGIEYAISDAIAVPAGGIVAVKPGVTLDGFNDFEEDAFNYDEGLFTSPSIGLFAFELEIEGTSVTADGAGALTLKGLANGGDREIASEIMPGAYGTAGANSKWHARFCSVAFLDEDEDFYFAVSRVGAPAAIVTDGRFRIIKLLG